MSNFETREEAAARPIDKEAADAFWCCFLEKEDAYFQMDLPELLDALARLMEAHAPALAMEVSGDRDDSERELILTAHGDKAQFHSLEVLQRATPNLKRFSSVIAFRQRMNDPDFGINMDQMELLAKDIQVALFSDRGLVGLELAFARTISSAQMEQAKHMAFIMLDHVIGEYDFAVRVGFVEFVDQVSQSAENRCSLDELPETFDRFLHVVLGYTWNWPDESGKSDWVMLTAASVNEHGRPNIVSVRREVRSLALRADLAHRLDVSVDVGDAESLDRARELQEALCQLMEINRGAILVLTLVLMDEGRRVCRFYTGDPHGWVSKIQEKSRLYGFHSPRIDIAFDPSWDAYLSHLPETAT